MASVSETSPLTANDYAEEYEESFKSTACGCLRGLCFQRRKNGTAAAKAYLLQEQQQDQVIRESWLAERVKKIKEITEILAGPKWKNFIRRFSVNGGVNKKRKSQFQYDAQSYKLNFDDGISKEGDAAFCDFSARYAAPVCMNKGEAGRGSAGL